MRDECGLRGKESIVSLEDEEEVEGRVRGEGGGGEGGRSI